jgi:hypothetical protein
MWHGADGPSKGVANSKTAPGGLDIFSRQLLFGYVLIWRHLPCTQRLTAAALKALSNEQSTCRSTTTYRFFETVHASSFQSTDRAVGEKNGSICLRGVLPAMASFRGFTQTCYGVGHNSECGNAALEGTLRSGFEICP